jgi:hypothetical protein
VPIPPATILVSDHQHFQESPAEEVTVEDAVAGDSAVYLGAKTKALGEPARYVISTGRIARRHRVQRDQARSVIGARGTRDGLRHYFLSASTPGRGLPSIHSRKAPPAVET